MEYEGKVKLESISPKDGYHYFFGYYDLQPYDKKGERHLAHRVKFADRIPNENDVAEVGYITLKDKVFHKIAESRAWNFQQGCMLQWFDDENIIYNDFRDGKYCTVIKSVDGVKERIIDMPLANVSLDRKWGLSINFARIWNFRPGYGYCNVKDEFYDEKAPENDGIFLVNLEDGTSKLVLSYKRINEIYHVEPFCDMKILVNHITFNPSGTRFLFLLRNFPEPGKIWGTLLMTSDLEGKDVRALTGYEVNSHYYWKNDKEIIIYSGLPSWGIYFINDETGNREKLDDDLINYDDIHCIYSPDRKCFIGDGYPNTGCARYILMYDFDKKKSRAILKIPSDPVNDTDIRCDLHNRFNRNGTEVSIDSYQNGLREILRFPFDREELMK